MHREIEQRQTVMVPLELNGVVPDFNFPFIINFPADEVVVKTVVYNTTEAASSRVYVVHSDLVDDGFMCAFPAIASTSQLDLSFPLRMFQKGTRTIQIQDDLGALTTHATGTVILFLEFRKFKKEPKPKKE
jgi:hypothetical protein